MDNIDVALEQASIEKNVSLLVETIYDTMTQQNNTLPFWERVIKMLPEVEGKITKYDTRKQIQCTIFTILEKRFEEEKEQINYSLEEKRKLVDTVIRPCVMEMLTLFQMKQMDTDKIKCYLGFFNPFPRDVIKKEYFLHYDVSNEIFIRASLHEINHMILFDKWKSMYGYDKEGEPEFPDPLWYLEELTIEPTLNGDKIQQMAPFGHRAYESFYQIEIDGELLPNTINRIFLESRDMEQYLDDAYQYLTNNIEKIIGK